MADFAPALTLNNAEILAAGLPWSRPLESGDLAILLLSPPWRTQKSLIRK